MKTIKITIIALTLFLIGSLITVFFSLEEEDYADHLIWAVHLFSDYQVEEVEFTTIDITKNPKISMKDLRVRTESGDQEITAGFVEIQFSLMSLFSDRLDIENLIVRNAEIVVNDQKSSLDVVVIPIIEHAEFINVHLSCNCQNGKQLELDIEDISIFDHANGEISISGIGEFEQTPFHLTGLLGAPSQLNQKNQLFPVDLALQFSDSSFLIKGNLEDPLELEGFDLEFTGDVVELSDIVQHFITTTPALGQAHINFVLKGDWDDLRITDINATINNNMGIDIRADGSINNLLDDFEATLNINGSISEPDLIKQLVTDTTPVISDELQFNGLVEFNQYSGSIKKLNIQLFGEQIISMDISGTGLFKTDDAYPSDTKLDLEIAMTSPSTMVFGPIIGVEIPELGKVSANAKLELTDQALSLSDINIIVGSEEHLKIMVLGKSDKFTFGSDIYQTALDLDIELFGQNIKHLLPPKYKQKHILGIDLLTAKLKLSGSINKSELYVENITAHHIDEITVQAHGKVQLGDLRQPDPIKNLSLDLDSQIVKMKVLSSWVETKLPLLGAIRTKTRMQGQGQYFSFQDMQVTIGDKSSVWMQLKGNIDDIYYADGIVWSSLTMKAEFLAWDSNPIAAYLNMSLPDIKKTSGVFTLSGDSKSLTVRDLNFTIISLTGIRLVGTGSVKNSGLLEDAKMSGVDINLVADADSNTRLNSMIQYDLPDFGALHATARLFESQDELRLEDIILTIGNSDKPIIHATGQIHDISNNHRVNIITQLEIESSVILEHILDKELPEIGTVTAIILISNNDGSLGIESLELSSGSTKLYQLTAKGNFNDIHNGDELKLDLNLTVPKPKLLGERLGYEVADFEAIKFVGTIEGSNEHAVFKGELDIGKTYFESNIVASHIDGRPAFKGTLHTQHLDLKDLAIHHEKITLDNANKQSDRLFSSEKLPFDLVKNIDLDLHITADEIKGIKFNIDSADALVRIHNNILTIDPASLIFDDGFVNMSASIAADTEQPYITLNLQAKNIDIGDLSSQLIESSYIEGALTAHTSISGTGYSLAEISDSLDGDVAVALDNGVLHGADLSLLNIDFMGWFFDHLVQKQQTDIHCAMSHYQIENGLADVKMLILTTPDLEASGNGNINLKDETIDLTIYTDDKSIFRSQIPISVKGNLRNPSVTLLPSINTLTSVIFSVIPEFILADIVLSEFWDLLSRGDANSKCEEFLP